MLERSGFSGIRASIIIFPGSAVHEMGLPWAGSATSVLNGYNRYAVKMYSSQMGHDLLSLAESVVDLYGVHGKGL
jgi:hypothetical protein